MALAELERFYWTTSRFSHKPETVGIGKGWLGDLAMTLEGITSSPELACPDAIIHSRR